MKTYSLSVKLKLGLIVFAVLIALASLAYTNYLVDRLRQREQAIVRLWAGANEQLVQAPTQNPYQRELNDLQRLVARLAIAPEGAGLFIGADPDSLRKALEWASSMPPADQVNFIINEIIIPNPFGIPAVITDSAFSAVLFDRNVPVDASLEGAERRERLLRQAREMAEVYPPLTIELGEGARRLRQYVYYDESRLIKELRAYPFVQLLFVGLFILVGYLSFSYVRRSEQSSLWVGMAKEAAHQLGTPISSLMGWTELLKTGSLPPEQVHTALDEIEKDIERLRRVTSRFSDIGSLPKLQVMDLGAVIANTAGYMRRRIPQQGKRVALDVRVPEGLCAPLNPELFEWVIENLIKNALDAIETEQGRIDVEAHRENGRVLIDVHDTGKGIDRRQWKNIFRPGYSTKKRGWGLGLSLAKRIVEDYHGGALLLLQSKPGQGSTFRIELPLQEAPVRRIGKSG